MRSKGIRKPQAANAQPRMERLTFAFRVKYTKLNLFLTLLPLKGGRQTGGNKQIKRYIEKYTDTQTFSYLHRQNNYKKKEGNDYLRENMNV